MRLRIAAVSVLLCVLYVPSFGQTTKSPRIVSLVQLLASPEKFNGKAVVVFGFLNIIQEGNRLYLGKSDYENALLPNSIWIEVSNDMLTRKSELNQKYVRMEGVFHTKSLGMPPEDAGGIGEISQCKLWSDPEHPLLEKIRRLMPQ